MVAGLLVFADRGCVATRCDTSSRQPSDYKCIHREADRQHRHGATDLRRSLIGMVGAVVLVIPPVRVPQHSLLHREPESVKSAILSRRETPGLTVALLRDSSQS